MEMEWASKLTGHTLYMQTWKDMVQYSMQPWEEKLCTKINTVSSIETEVLLVCEKLSKYLWFRNFAVEQSDGPSQVHVLYQDNKSTILLQNNGRLCCGKGSKYIHIQYIFITDKI